jgi:UDP-N-acetylglucosamine diphosphorylase / glucose-1-phosphate thymidylyltransferase / UDP-N-acetylgalactosamine diphosphorylase / glucosamine-1-phosphate N-acetyltransferase / galactosamine-1-phosphate N-acetyltransferase
MKRIVLRDLSLIAPFGEPARDLRILNKPLWLLQRDLLARHCQSVLEVDGWDAIPTGAEELLVHKDNLYFNAAMIDTFIAAARATGQPCQVAFAHDDPMITAHGLRLQDGIRKHDKENVYVADIYYFPRGVAEQPRPLVVNTEPQEMGYYHIPSYMAPNQGDLVFQVPLRAICSIENWVQVLMTNSPLGVFAWGRRLEKDVEESWRLKLKIGFRSFIERKHFLSSSAVVKVGKNCSIDPTAIIQGPTVIGNNVNIGAGVVITNSLIGSNVTIMQGSQIMLSVVSDRCYLPFRAALL